VGGLGSLSGAIYGGLLIGLIETLSCCYISAAISPAITFSLLVLLLLLRPQGIAGHLVEEKF
jgi:branched-chain amino acid transport system permease protein